MAKISNIQQNFITYVRTKMLWMQRLRNEDEMDYVFISMEEIKKRFMPDAKNDIQYLVDAGEIDRIKVNIAKGFMYKYKAIIPGAYNFSLLEAHGKELDNVTTQMIQFLFDVSLSEGAPITFWFDKFLNYRNKNLRIFFTVDEFSGRVHTPISNFHRTHRPNILLQGEETYSIDVTTMQPLLLGKILKQKIGANEYSAWINSGEDIYIMLQNKAKLNTRDEAKKRFFEILFSGANDKLAEMFGSANWINWINEYKRQPEKSNPHTVEKEHSNLAWLLQNTEVEVMRKVWVKLLENKIPFLSVHDEIIIRQSDKEQAKQIFESVLNKEFEWYKLNSKTIAEPEQAPKDHELETVKIVENTDIQPCHAPEKIIGQAFWNKKPTEPTKESKAKVLIDYFKNTIMPDEKLILSPSGLCLEVKAYVKWVFDEIGQDKNKVNYFAYVGKLNELNELLSTVKYND